MVTKTLVERNIEDGGRIIEALDQSGFPVEAALWVFREQGDVWRLVIASSLVEQKGPLYAYARIQSTLEAMSPPPQLLLRNISVVSPKQELIRRLEPARPAARQGDANTNYEGWRFVSGDVYVYRTPVNHS